jgi:hypothetical protein
MRMGLLRMSLSPRIILDLNDRNLRLLICTYTNNARSLSVIAYAHILNKTLLLPCVFSALVYLLFHPSL